VALGDRCGCRVFVTLGGCRHLDGLEQQRSFSTSWSLFMAGFGDCMGSCSFLGGELKGNSSGLLVLLSYLTWVGSCGVHLLDEVYATPLSRRTTKCWSIQWGLACRQAHEPRERNLISCVIGFLPVIGLTSYYDWFTPLLSGIITLLTSLHFLQTSCQAFCVVSL
jgi:hypothetical protein